VDNKKARKKEDKGMEFFDVVKKRRSIRKFKPNPLPKGALEQILDAARFAMSGANGQPWEFVVIRKKKMIAKIADLYVEYGRKRDCAIEKTREMQYRHNMFKSFYPNLPGWTNAPVIIAVCGDIRTYQATVLSAHFLRGEGGPEATYFKNVGNATQLICLSAAALGLATQWVSTEIGWEPKVRELLDIPDDLMIHTMVPVGYGAYEPAPPYRRGLEEIVHYDKYDRSRYRTDDDIADFLNLLRKKTKAAYSETVID
jgi:nitroreductase